MLENRENYYCENCSCEVEVTSYIDEEALNLNLCMDCFFDEYTYCDFCGETVHIEEAETIESGEIFCQNCLDNNENIFYCEHHEQYEYDEDYFKLSDGSCICSTAIELGFYFICEDCGAVLDIDYAYWSENDSCNYCEECYINHQSNNKIKSYHEHEDEYEYNFRSTDQDKNEELYFGMELEVENVAGSNHQEDLAEELLEISNDFVFEDDGSLVNGFEIISYPFTRNYMKNNLEENIIKMLKTIKNFGFDSLDTCGLHFHVSNNAVKDETNLVLLVEYFKEELTIFSERKEENISRWSKFYTEGLKKEELTKKLIQNKIDDCWSRYRAVNLDNFNTIEFRIFKGTTDHKKLLATWELVNNIVLYSNNNELDINNMPTFKDVATYKENNYISEYIESMF